MQIGITRIKITKLRIRIITGIVKKRMKKKNQWKLIKWKRILTKISFWESEVPTTRNIALLVFNHKTIRMLLI